MRLPVLISLLLLLTQQVVYGLLGNRRADSAEKKLEKVLEGQTQFNTFMKCVTYLRDERRTVNGRQKRLDCLAAALSHRSSPQPMTIDEIQVMLQHLVKMPIFVTATCKKIYDIERSVAKLLSNSRNEIPSKLEKLMLQCNLCRLVEEDIGILIKTPNKLLRKLAF